MKINYLVFLSAIAAATACGGDDNSHAPTPPALGDQLERMGRAGINTAVNDTFNATAATTDASKDAYNHAAESDWSSFRGRFKASLAILDSLDATCGNQLAADQTAGARYDFLATVLLDDQVYVNSANSSCTQYLAVEATALGSALGSDCGGRAPAYDVIQTTYSALAAGALTGVDDLVTNDNTLLPDFPYLGVPN